MSKQKYAVIYCRVSTEKQANTLDGLTSQETRCREHAKYKGYKVVEVFQDKGVSGGLIDRPGMKAMLRFLKKKKSEEYVVLIFDITRLARSMEAHIALRTAISSVGGKLESPSMEFHDDDPNQKLTENVQASVSQHFREIISQQTQIRMRARLQNGYWVHKQSPGYRYARVPGHAGKMMVRDEPLASFMREVLEGYATDRFETQSEVKRFLENSSVFMNSRKSSITYQVVKRILENPLYAGYMNVPEWGIFLQPGKHEPLISFETWQTIQDKIKGKARAPARKDMNDDFPLRGFVTCGTCQKPMTACWSAGRKQKYPYYLCFTKGCSDYRKSIRKEKIEEEFEELLVSLRPTENLFNLAKEMFEDLWEERESESNREAILLKNKLTQVESKVSLLVERIVRTDSESLITTYENELHKLEEEKIVMSEKIQNCGRPLTTFDETFRTAFGFLSNPYKLWTSDRMEDKRSVLRLVFAERLPYYRNEGFRTAQTDQISLPFKVLENLNGSEYEVASPARFELASPA
jgi:site-specific DNA recombinase